MSYWETAKWPIEAGDEISHLHFEDLRKWLWLLEHRDAGHYNEPPEWSPGGGLPWDAGSVRVTYDGEIWTNEFDMVVNVHPPPSGGIDAPEHGNGWIRCASNNRYHHWDKNAHRWIINAHYSGGMDYVLSAQTYKWLPKHTDPKEQLPPVIYDDTERVAWRYNDKVEVKQGHISENIGAQYYSQYPWGEEPVPSVIWSNYGIANGEPDCIGEPYYDRKICDSYQAMAEYYTSVLRWVWRPTSTFKRNWLARYPGHAEWNPDAYPPHTPPQPFYAYMEGGYSGFGQYGEFWGCNGSGFELGLKLMGQYDWYWDTLHPFIPILLWELYIDDPAANPLPIGCWRRTWKYSMGRVGSIMWPQEAGEPPGYSDGTEYENYITSEGDAQQILASYEAAMEEHPEYERYLKERHDPVQIERELKGSDAYGEPIWEEHPAWEIHHNILNHIRSLLAYYYMEFAPLSWAAVGQSVNSVTDVPPETYNSIVASNAEGWYRCTNMWEHSGDPRGWNPDPTSWGYTDLKVAPNAIYWGLYTACKMLGCPFPTEYSHWNTLFYGRSQFALGLVGEISRKLFNAGNIAFPVLYQGSIGEPSPNRLPITFGLGDLTITCVPAVDPPIYRAFLGLGELSADKLLVCKILTPWPVPAPLCPPDGNAWDGHIVIGAIDVEDALAVVRYDWDKIPDSVWKRIHTLPVRLEVDPKDDDRPPVPDPPVWYKTPYLEDKNDCWEAPYNPPRDWWAIMVARFHEDLEGFDVQYKFIGHNGAPSSEWQYSRYFEVSVQDITDTWSWTFKTRDMSPNFNESSESSEKKPDLSIM